MSSIASAPAPKPGPTSNTGATTAIVLIVLVAVGVGGFFVYRMLRQVDRLNVQIDEMREIVQDTAEDADVSRQRAVDAEQSARTAAVSRDQAQEEADLSRQRADGANQRADAADQRADSADQRADSADQRAVTAEQASVEAREEARLASERVEEVRRAAAAEMNRLAEALGKIADTRRTALGLVMSLDEGYLKFGFDTAELRPASREVLSRIGGILLAADDFAITVRGHTDARGTEEYNQDLSERRARAVADYLVDAGLSAALFTVQGLGKSQLRDQGNSEEAHSRNRRVELGLINSRMIQ
jgi:outer membrane protein OmpA-like peptidoglycan-associated protein